MRWPWQRREPASDSGGEALAETRERLEEIRERREENRGVFASLREFREENHLAERVRSALGGS